MDTILELKNISKKYGASSVLKNINLEIKNNEFFTILGSSGSGKSTLIRIIGGFVKSSSGNIIFDNKIINDEPIFKRPFNTVFQDYALFPNMNVYNNIAFGLMIRKLSKNLIQEKVEKVLETVGLNQFKFRMPHEISGGQQQRVALARAIVCEPKVILLDEPLGALDAELRKQMQLFLKDIQKKIKTTFVFITHDQDEAIFLSDRIAVLNNHQFEQVGSPKELYYKPKSKYLASFFGECNLIDGLVKEVNNDQIMLDSEIGSINIQKSNNEIEVGKKFTFAIRPEEILIENSISDKENSFKVKVEEIEFKGSITNILIKLNNGSQFKIQLDNMHKEKAIKKDDEINIYINPKLGNLFINE